MNILLWHVHGSWTTAFVEGDHRYLLPVDQERSTWGRGRARTWQWPPNAVEVPLERLRHEDVDIALIQRPEELELLRRWLARNVPLVYLEHNAPDGDVPNSHHPMADRDDIQIVHVTHFNDLFWDCGGTRTRVIEHGIVAPRAQYSGELERLAVVTNDPIRRGRITGTDLMRRFADAVPLDVYGMGVRGLAKAAGTDRIIEHDDPPQHRMHASIARRRAYLHLCRWTSLGLSLIEAMAIGLPVVALATTEAAEAIPPDAAVLSTRVSTLVDAARWLVDQPEEARMLGARGREVALKRFGLERFLADWDSLLQETLRASR